MQSKSIIRMCLLFDSVTRKCYIAYLGNTSLSLATIVLITGSYTSVCICWDLSHSSILKITPKFLCCPSSLLLGFGERRGKSLGFFPSVEQL